MLDPDGVYGLAVLSAYDEVEAQGVAAADPVIRADAGFRFEIAPMMALVTKDNVDE